MIIPGLQTRGLFCLHCEISPESIAIGRLWLRDLELLGQTLSIVQSDGSDRYTVQMPENLPENPIDNVVLNRVNV